MEPIAVFGIGSTNFRYAIMTSTGEFLTEITVEPTQPERLTTQLVDAVAALIQTSSVELTAVSVSCTGLVDQATGCIRELDTQAGTTVHDLELRRVVQDEFDLPLILENDCSASAFGEWYFGAGEEYDCIAHVTLGTGIGAGIVERGRLLRGESGQAAEVGLFPIAGDTDLESFGVPGAWEAVCSGRGIPEYVTHRLQTEDRNTVLDETTVSTAQVLFEAACDGDRVAVDYLDQIAQYNAAGIGTLCNAYNPGIVTLGGGVALHNPHVVVDGIQTYLEDYLFVEEPAIQITDLGDDIGLYGAVAHYCESTTK